MARGDAWRAGRYRILAVTAGRSQCSGSQVHVGAPGESPIGQQPAIPEAAARDWLKRVAEPVICGDAGEHEYFRRETCCCTIAALKNGRQDTRPADGSTPRPLFRN